MTRNQKLTPLPQQSTKGPQEYYAESKILAQNICYIGTGNKTCSQKGISAILVTTKIKFSIFIFFRFFRLWHVKNMRVIIASFARQE